MVHLISFRQSPSYSYLPWILRILRPFPPPFCCPHEVASYWMLLLFVPFPLFHHHHCFVLVFQLTRTSFPPSLIYRKLTWLIAFSDVFLSMINILNCLFPFTDDYNCETGVNSRVSKEKGRGQIESELNNNSAFKAPLLITGLKQCKTHYLAAVTTILYIYRPTAASISNWMKWRSADRFKAFLTVWNLVFFPTIPKEKKSIKELQRNPLL